jgi:hypothetical protein
MAQLMPQKNERWPSKTGGVIIGQLLIHLLDIAVLVEISSAAIQ